METINDIALEKDEDIKVSPMMAQWHACKKFAKTAVLLFRMGDFYEAFYEDAVIISRELDITLTKRQDIPMAGLPWHTSEGYIDKLVGKGFHVAVAEQMEDPKKTKGLVRREVTRVVTPGTIVNSSLLSDQTNNFFAAITQVGSFMGLAFLDLTTSEFYAIEFEQERDLLNELYRINPAEILTSNKFHDKHKSFFGELKQAHSHILINLQEDWHFDHQIAHDFLTAHLKVHSLDGFGLRGMVASINAGGALLAYIQDHLCLTIDHIHQINVYSTSQFLSLDRITQRNLELSESLNDGTRKNTLLHILDKTRTAMGARLMRKWVKQPLLSVEDISKRQDAIQNLYLNPQIMEKLSHYLENIRDLERLMMKIMAGYALPRDLTALRFSFENMPQLKELLTSFTAPLLVEEAQKIETLQAMTALIAQAIVDEPPARLIDGRVFRDGYHRELDELREISKDSKTWLARYQNELREQTGIKTLKLGFTRIFGYYIEVSKGQAVKMPENFQRRQTLVNAERYITPELKEYETKVLNAEERISSIEIELFNALRIEVAGYGDRVLSIAQALARIDCLHALAEVAKQQGYIRPIVDNSQLLHIEEGRHPVIEAALFGEKFIANDTIADNNDNRLFIITGPNMAGKSTYIRQVALIVIMAQIGSFIPAKSAHIGIIDKVFTRIGASDDLSRGQSTFMVEMTETANILHNATERSLVILDEIGRGTSTYDGISIAWAVAEYLLITPGKRAKTLFATHYWELTKLQERIPGAVNYNVAVCEHEDHIIFLRKIVKGDTDKSYGIHVGRLAGLPQSLIARAKEILAHLEENSNRKSAFEPALIKKIPAVKAKNSQSEVQLLFFEPPKKRLPKNKPEKILDDIQKMNLEQLTPLQAHTKLAELQAALKKNE